MTSVLREDRSVLDGALRFETAATLAGDMLKGTVAVLLAACHSPQAAQLAAAFENPARQALLPLVGLGAVGLPFLMLAYGAGGWDAAVRGFGAVRRGELDAILVMDRYSVLFLVEMSLFALPYALLLWRMPRNASVTRLATTSAWVVFSFLVISLHTVYLAALFGGWLAPHGLIWLALAAYAANRPVVSLYLDVDGKRIEIESHVTHTFRFLSQIPWTRSLRRATSARPSLAWP